MKFLTQCSSQRMKTCVLCSTTQNKWSNDIGRKWPLEWLTILWLAWVWDSYKDWCHSCFLLFQRYYHLSQSADQNHCLPQKWTHKVSNISRYVLLTSQSYRFPRHHCLASDINLCCRVWFCIRSSISWCAGQTDQALTNSLHIALRRTDCIASCVLLHFVDQIILQEERITLWVALHWIVTIHPRWQIRSVQMTAWQESSICSNHHFALNHQIGTQVSDRHSNYQRYYHGPADG